MKRKAIQLLLEMLAQSTHKNAKCYHTHTDIQTCIWKIWNVQLWCGYDINHYHARFGNVFHMYIFYIYISCIVNRTRSIRYVSVFTVQCVYVFECAFHCLPSYHRIALSVGYPNFINNSSWYFIRFYEFQWIFVFGSFSKSKSRILFTHFTTQKCTHNRIKEAKRTLSNSFPSLRLFSHLLHLYLFSRLSSRCVSLPWSRGLPFWPLRYLCTLNYCNWLLYYADQFKFGFWLKIIICVRDHKFDGFVHRER